MDGMYQLNNAAGEKFTLHFWVLATTFKLARRYGWNGNQTVNGDVTLINSDDAAALADALEEALDDIPDVEMPAPHPNDLYGNFSGVNGKNRLRSFVTFCRGGAFRFAITGLT